MWGGGGGGGGLHVCGFLHDEYNLWNSLMTLTQLKFIFVYHCVCVGGGGGGRGVHVCGLLHDDYNLCGTF